MLFCNKPIDLKPEFKTNNEILSVATPIAGYTTADIYVANGYMGKLSYYTGDSIAVYISAKSIIRKARLGVFAVVVACGMIESQ